jgi:hypothetical protein
MKQIDKSIILILSILILGFTFSASATADTRLHFNGLHIALGGDRNHYKYNHGYNHRYPKYKAQSHHQRHSSHTYGHDYSNYRKPCHQVSKIYHDEYGDPHRISGTMCYDRYGTGYVVEGSRYHLN